MAPTLADLMKARLRMMRKVVKLQPDIIAYNVDTIDMSILELDRAKIEKWSLSAETLHDDTFTLCATEAEFAHDHEPELETLQGGIKSLLSKVIIMIRTRTEKTATGPSPHFKLERVKLPQFSGNFAEWQSFRDLFVASVHKNNTLSGAEKMVHLKSCLTGDAASIVSSFQATEANYKEAWESVIKRYDSKKEIVFAHLKKYDDFAPLKVESGLGLRQLSDSINECVRSLKVMKVPVDDWDIIIIYLAVRKLDPESRKQWSLEQEELAADLPDLDDFTTFLESRARALQDMKPPEASKPTSTSSSSFAPRTHGKKSSSHSAQHSSSSLSCVKCKKGHHLHTCKDFASASVAERRAFVYQHKLCFNCLFAGHACQQCPMQFSCRKCGLKHHTLIHPDSERKETPTVPVIKSETSSAVSSNNSETVVLLATLLVSVQDSAGQQQVCRVFLDSGSESNFISESCVQRLGLSRKKTCVSVSGIGGVTSESAKGLVTLELQSRTGQFAIDVSALVLRKLTANLLPRHRCQSDWPHLHGLQLSDPSFHQPGRIDILLGASVAGSIMLPGLVQGPPNSPVAQLTKFGWILSGCVPSIQESSSSAVQLTFSSPVQVFTCHATCDPNHECQDLLERMWKLDEFEFNESSLSSEEQQCEEHFIATHQRNSDGGYTVELPFKSTGQVLGNSRDAAVKRFLRVESRLIANPSIHSEYVKAMRDAISSKFIELVPAGELSVSSSSSYYMPHREVVKESSSTTKVRIVYDASAKSSSGYSLNDLLLTGPKLQADLVPLLIKFRSHLIAMSADIEKFYPQFHVNKKHVDFQRLVWRESPQEPLRDYRLLRVTFGVTSAPFLAIRCLHQLAEDEMSSFPVACRIIKEDFLVDNLLTGSQDVDSALQIQKDILSVMQRGNLKLTKWTSNSEEVLQAVPADHREYKSALKIDDTELVRTIGLLWQPSSDTFGVSIVVPDLDCGSSKRKVLSSLARIFDPLGWLSPVTIRPKVMMQELWKSKCDWDSELPSSIHDDWFQYCKELPTLTSFKIRRCITRTSSGSPSSSRFELHGFSDASKLAYTGCVYIRTINHDGVSAVSLVLAKAKVAPVKTETIPRLELCGAVLVSRLMKLVRDCLDLDFSIIHCWTDSTIVLGWLASSEKLPIFNANRVRQIEHLVPNVKWFHVPGAENPADIPTRRISASSFIKNQLWLNGPPWFETRDFHPEIVVSSSISTVSNFIFSNIINNFSSYFKMRRVAAFCLRFANNCQKSKAKRVGQLTIFELDLGLQHLLLCVQAESFGAEIRHCQRKELIKSRIKFLCPFLDSQGILRVGGRLEHASGVFDRKHPVLLPTHHNFVLQLIRHHHLSHLHAGPQLLLAILREQFWIVRGLDVIKKVIRGCVICHRFNPATATQIMGQLPAPRVTPSRPFSESGVDFAGAFSLCLRPGRNPIIRKGYVALFVCMATRAIHLELVEDLSTAAFLGSLTRFVARRGLPANIYSDGGTNFVGAKNEIMEIQHFLKANAPQVSNFLLEKGITFHFNPPGAPHHGGLWEAGVKSMKHHLKRVIGDRKLSLEEFATLLAQVESCLNSRPIGQMSNDPNDFECLTPAHFLIGSSLKSLPQHDLTHLPVNRLSRWQAVQQMFQHFWKRWSLEYIGSLQSRPKWIAPTPNLDVGVLVLIRDDDPAIGPLRWKLGRIVAVYPGKDDHVRVCDVRTVTGSILKRPIVKLSPLPIYEGADHELLSSGAANAGENVRVHLSAFCEPL